MNVFMLCRYCLRVVIRMGWVASRTALSVPSSEHNECCANYVRAVGEAETDGVRLCAGLDANRRSGRSAIWKSPAELVVTADFVESGHYSRYVGE